MQRTASTWPWALISAGMTYLAMYGVALPKSLVMVAMMPWTIVGLVVMIPTLRSALVLEVTKLMLPT